MRYWIDLLETALTEAIDVERTLAAFGTKIEARLKREGSGSTPDQALDEMLAADPTPNKMYTKWILARYLDGGINRIEDLSRLKHALGVFHKLKTRMPEKDINRIKSLSALEDMVEPFEDQKTGRQERKDDEAALTDQIDVFFSGPEGKIKIPKTKEAAIFLGRGTKWCTAATKSQNMFDHYEKDGPLYVILPRDGTKYQFQFGSKQFMDANDDAVFDKPETGLHFDATYPWVFKALLPDETAWRKVIARCPQLLSICPSTDIVAEQVRRTPTRLKYVPDAPESLVKQIVGDDFEALASVVHPTVDMVLDAFDHIDAERQGGTVVYVIDRLLDKMTLNRAIWEKAIAVAPQCIRHLKNPPDDLQVKAVSADYHAIVGIRKPCEAAMLAAVRQNAGSLWDFVDNVDGEVPESVQLAIVRGSPNMLRNLEQVVRGGCSKAVRDAAKKG